MVLEEIAAAEPIESLLIRLILQGLQKKINKKLK